MKVRWAPHAESALLRIVEHIAADSPPAAWALARDIVAATSRLSEFPFSGRIGYDPRTRELVIRRNYLVVYRVWNDGVEVLQVWHGAQNRHG